MKKYIYVERSTAFNTEFLTFNKTQVRYQNGDYQVFKGDTGHYFYTWKNVVIGKLSTFSIALIKAVENGKCPMDAMFFETRYNELWANKKIGQQLRKQRKREAIAKWSVIIFVCLIIIGWVILNL